MWSQVFILTADKSWHKKIINSKRWVELTWRLSIFFCTNGVQKNCRSEIWLKSRSVQIEFFQRCGQNRYSWRRTIHPNRKIWEKWFGMASNLLLRYESTTYFTTGSINGENYRTECIKKWLLPIYWKHTMPPLFLPDLASAHYASATLEMLKKE